VPYVIRPKRRKAHLAGIIAAALLAFVGLPAVAQADCPDSPLSQPFKQSGDSSYYSLIPNGDFSSGTAGWTLRNAKLVSGSNGNMLQIDNTGEAVSPPFCIDKNYPTFRFYADTTRGWWTSLNVGLRYPDGFGALHDLNLSSLFDSSFPSLAPTGVLPLQTKLPFWQRSDTLTVRLVFDPNMWGNDWTIDNVYVDPYRR